MVFVGVGLVITIAFEMWALDTGRWRYESRMPTVLGIGLDPIVQWLVLPVLEIALLRRRVALLRTF